ncbi:hypothetical protein LXL04_028333 [Taraxacum kok-saghyz]
MVAWGRAGQPLPHHLNRRYRPTPPPRPTQKAGRRLNQCRCPPRRHAAAQGDTRVRLRARPPQDPLQDPPLARRHAVVRDDTRARPPQDPLRDPPLAHTPALALVRVRVDSRDHAGTQGVEPSDPVQFRDGETQTRASHRTVHYPKDFLAPGIGSCSVFTYVRTTTILLTPLTINLFVKPSSGSYCETQDNSWLYMALHDYQVKNGQGEDQLGSKARLAFSAVWKPNNSIPMAGSGPDIPPVFDTKALEALIAEWVNATIALYDIPPVFRSCGLLSLVFKTPHNVTPPNLSAETSEGGDVIQHFNEVRHAPVPISWGTSSPQAHDHTSYVLYTFQQELIMSCIPLIYHFMDDIKLRKKIHLYLHAIPPPNFETSKRRFEWEVKKKTAQSETMEIKSWEGTYCLAREFGRRK